ncbi:hypothetical protein G7B40_035740 [Aetokthonos hydrillicola Thurmond2011]|jgi:hypothetical protein|uniref:Uncharacterized protein n=1 Tax=Aetokthonos hydrillicola Thurmond2011 TaxID=2712845 RepID=A0AAP5M963_9CYAN|nr:hypothetical protein [Aetokthonos hydrillicola]MBO3460723.1 hypothetical protein [Aetokthonos hydrillicola CCALA 1050]MBW4586420.1 hypothetical protein [Aetokthonos hydrillicola CCALA 1050]MDR9899871.1 hypothetical protein [Aetokthonos hydrillicola Thurmond2011]
MADIRKLIDQIAIAQAQLYATQFLAPCVKGGRVRTRVAGMVYTFTPKPSKFEGWGIFEPVDEKTATVVEQADLPEIVEYLQQFSQIRLRLVHQLRSRTWLAYPVNEVDMRQRLKVVKPLAVHLVTEGVTFEQIIARLIGHSCWFEEVDRRSDPAISETLQSAVTQLIPPSELHFKGITPEIRTVYELAIQRIEGFAQPQQDEKRLRKALQMGGGTLTQFYDRGDYWTVDWTTADGVRHSSAIAKTDLTVISSGICLSGRDRDFDLQSLVGVMEQQ